MGSDKLWQQGLGLGNLLGVSGGVLEVMTGE